MKIELSTLFKIIGVVVVLVGNWYAMDYRIKLMEKSLEDRQLVVDSLKEEMAKSEMLQMMCECYEKAKLESYKKELGIE